MTAYLDLADYLLIAERVLGLPAEAMARTPIAAAWNRPPSSQGTAVV